MNLDVRNKLYTYFIERWGMYTYKGDWLKGTCPHCGRENKFGVNMQENKAHCFSCDDHTNPLMVVKQIEKMDTFGEVYNMLSTLDNVNIIKRVFQEEKFVASSAKLPEGFRLLKDGDSVLARNLRKYLRGRGLNVTKLNNKGWGYCEKGKYFGHLVTPWLYEGKLIYFNSRRFIGYGEKYKNPTTEEVGIGKNQVFYNWDALFLYNTVYLVESAINAETLGGQAVASGGKALSSFQKKVIKKSPCKNMVILLDRDAWKESIKLGFEMLDYKRIKIIIPEDNRDVNDLGKSITMQNINNAKYLTHQDLIKLKNKFHA